MIFIQFPVEISPVAVGVRVLRVQRDGFAEILQGLLIFVQLLVQISPVVVGKGVIGVQPDGLAEILQGLLIFVQFAVEISPVVVGGGVAGVHPDRLRVLLHRLLQAALFGGAEPPAEAVLGGEGRLPLPPLLLLLLGRVHGPEGLLHLRLLVQPVPLVVVFLDPVVQHLLQLLLGEAGPDIVAVQGFSDFHHQRVKPAGGHEAAAPLLYKRLDILPGQTGGLAFAAIAPVHPVGHGGAVLLQEGHQAVVAAGIADHDGRVGAEGLAQGPLPLRLQLLGGIRAVEGRVHQPAVHLRHNGALDVGLDVIRQGFVADDQGPFVRVEEQSVFHQAVKICGDDEVVEVVLRQQLCQRVITQARGAALHDFFKIAVALMGIGVEAEPVDIKVVLAGNGTARFLGPQPRVFDLLEGMVQRLFPVQGSGDSPRFAGVHGRHAAILHPAHQAIHPLHLQGAAAGNAGFHRRAGAQDEAEPLAAFGGLLYHLR